MHEASLHAAFNYGAEFNYEAVAELNLRRLRSAPCGWRRRLAKAPFPAGFPQTLDNRMHRLYRAGVPMLRAPPANLIFAGITKAHSNSCGLFLTSAFLQDPLTFNLAVNFASLQNEPRAVRSCSLPASDTYLSKRFIAS
ncbi:MAG: hypothetical protein QOF02_3331 [Blastocatellia bacterium]|jgi:hypothetical protein|nr:hypothetical protein [Blastocatellia bacterium]